MNKYGKKTYTYLLHWIETDMSYYGYRGENKVEPENDLLIEYPTSSQYVKNYVKKYGEPDIVMIDQRFESIEEAKAAETKYFEMFNIPSIGWLNMSNGISPFWGSGIKLRGRTLSDEHKRKISESSKNRVITEAIIAGRKKQSEKMKGNKSSLGHPSGMLGKNWSDEHRQAFHEANRIKQEQGTNKRRPLNESEKQNLSNILKGRRKPPRTPEHTARIEATKKRNRELKLAASINNTKEETT